MSIKIIILSLLISFCSSTTYIDEYEEKIVEAKYFLQEAAFLNKNAAVAWIAKRDALEQFRVELKKNNYWAVVRGPYGEAELGRMRSNGGFENTYMISASDLLN